jgi:hypothetical protein
MFNAADRAAIVARVDRLVTDAPRRWGKMTAPQMVWHLDAQLRWLLGELEVKPRGNAILRSALMKWYIIDSPLPWPRGKAPTAPELARHAPGEWSQDIAKLKLDLERWAARGQEQGACVHAAFGPLDGRQTGKLIWRHFDHHLQQFGV